MSAARVLADARAAGVELFLDGGRVRMRHRAGAPPPPELVARLRAHKPAVWALLVGRASVAATGAASVAAVAVMSDDERAEYEERAGIRQFVGGMSRADAERAALEDVRAAAVEHQRRAQNGRAVA